MFGIIIPEIFRLIKAALLLPCRSTQPITLYIPNLCSFASKTDPDCDWLTGTLVVRSSCASVSPHYFCCLVRSAAIDLLNSVLGVCENFISSIAATDPSIPSRPLHVVHCTAAWCFGWDVNLSVNGGAWEQELVAQGEYVRKLVLPKITGSCRI